MTEAPKTPNVVWQDQKIERADRERVLGQRGRLMWFTGLSGSGKSTVAVELEARLNALGRAAYLLDGDNIRHGLCGDLGFSYDDRRENIRRIGEVAKLFVDAGLIALCAFISPYREDREWIRSTLDPGDFIEVHVATPLEVCEARDVKGLYRRARAGEIPNFTGISSPYEPPLEPEVVVDTSTQSLEETTDELLRYLGLIR